MSDEWVVIGGNGKPRKSKAAAAVSGGREAATAAAAAVPPPLLPPLELQPHQPLPGWAADAAPASQQTQPTAGGRRRPRAAARTPEERLSALAASVDACRREVAASPAFAALRAALAAAEARSPWRAAGVKRLVIYGLGCVEDSRVSRYQLALALLLRDALLPGLAAPPQLADPAFSQADAALLAALGMTVVAADERAGRAVDEATFFYLPHLEVSAGSGVYAIGFGMT
jgi:hypothetical protein